MSNEKIYFAGPWFNPAQAERYEAVLSVLREWEAAAPGRTVFVPRDHPCPPISDDATRRDIYDGNLENIVDATKVVAITDEKDIGTIYELGYAARVRDQCSSGLDLVGVALTLGDKPFNLMLAVGLDGTCRTIEELRALLLEGRRSSFEGVIE